MAYETVVISSQPYFVYGDVPSAKLYLNADVSSIATAWLVADAVTQARSLVAAVRWMDEQNWLGLPTDQTTPQALAFPRTGLIDQNGKAIDPNTIPPQISFAEFQLAAALVDNPDLRDQLQDPKASSLGAGSAQIQFFRPVGVIYGAKDVQVLSVFPQYVMDLVGVWLGGSNPSCPVRTKGTHGKNQLVRDYPGLEHGV